MNFSKVNNILRVLKLSGREVNANDIKDISESEIELTESELAEIPFLNKKIIEGKVHVLDFDNKLVLKPVNIKNLEDKTPPKLNKVKDYEKDGGDAVKVNKNMIDSEGLNEERRHPYTNYDLQLAQDVLDKKRSKLSNATHTNMGDLTKKELEDIELKKLLKRKKQRDTANRLLRKTNEDAEDATVFGGDKFTDDDRDEYLGLSDMRDVLIKLPPTIKADANKRIKEIKNSIRDYDDKGYNDGAGANSNKNKAIDAIEQILDNLRSNDYEGFKEAQQFFLTLMSPITDLLPASLVNFLASGETTERGNDEIMTKVEPFETDVKENHTLEGDEVKAEKDIKESKRSISQILQEKKKNKKMKKDPCWDSHEMVGHKKGKNGEKVPNCVPKS